MITTVSIPFKDSATVAIELITRLVVLVSEEVVTIVTSPQPHGPGAVSSGFFGQPSLQSGVPSDSR